MNEKLLPPSDLAKLLGVSTRQITDRYAHHPNFPKAIRLPSLKGKGLMRWRESAIMEWLDRQQKAA